MKIRKLTEDDIGKIVAIIHDVMGPGDAKKALQDMKISLDMKTATPYKFEEFYVVEVDGEIVAAGGIWAMKYDPDIARLDWFAVPKKYQRKGFGTILMKFLETQLKKRKIKLILAETSNGKEYTAAINFYTKNGFNPLAHIANYWEDKSGLIYFMKRLK